MDGVDLVKLALGEPDARAHDALYWRSGHYRSILAGGWKLQVSERPKETWLFDMNGDPTEKTNVAESQPEKVAELRALLAQKDAEMVAPLWPALIEGPISIDHSLADPARFDGDFVYWAN
jgi:arylsulfatase A-like enzyme